MDLLKCYVWPGFYVRHGTKEPTDGYRDPCSRARTPRCVSGGLGPPSSVTPPTEDIWLVSRTDTLATTVQKSLCGGLGARAAACIRSKSPSQITSVILRSLERIPVNLIYTRKSHYSFQCQMERQASGSQTEFQKHSAQLQRFSLRLRLSWKLNTSI